MNIPQIIESLSSINGSDIKHIEFNGNNAYVFEIDTNIVNISQIERSPSSPSAKSSFRYILTINQSPIFEENDVLCEVYKKSRFKSITSPR